MYKGTPAASGSARCAQMVQCLREAFVYSEKRPRDLLFDEIENLLDGPPIMLSRLSREAARSAQKVSQASGVQCANWDIACKAVVNAMLGAHVFLTTDDRVVTAGVAARAALITGLRSHFREATEAYLLTLLIAGLGDVRIYDHVALAHALFRRFDQSVSIGEMEDQVVVLLAMLTDRVTLRDDGTYSVNAFVSPLVEFDSAHA
jgi:hypothetical protein